MKLLHLYLFIIIILFSCSPKAENDADPEFLAAKNIYDSSFIYLEQNNKQKAFSNLNKAKDIFQKKEDSFQVAKCLVNMAIIQEEESDNLGSIETSLAATKYLNTKDSSQFSFITSNYNNLGVASNSLRNFKDAQKFYLQALQFSKDTLDHLMVKNNLAASLHAQGKFAQSGKIYQDLLASLNSKDEVYHKIAVNHARSAWMASQDFHPEPIFRDALAFYTEEDDQWGLDAVYCYFTEYYLDKNKDSTMFYGKKMLEISRRLASPSDQLQALDFLIKTESESNSKKYFTEYKKLSDSLDVVQNSTKNQFALIRFESEKNKAHNLKLEKDLQQKEYMLYSGLLLLLISVFGGYYWYEKRKTRIELKAQNQIKEERLLTSKKVHDVVANGLYQVMSNLEHHDSVDKDEILDQLDGMYQRSRDISYDNFTIPQHINFREKFSELAHNFQNDDLSIFMVGNDDELWNLLTENFSQDLYLIIREFFVNMKKHSKASRVILKFEKSDDSLKVIYKDNGVGNLNEKDKNGLRGIRERVLSHNGEIFFDNHQGFIIEMNFKI